MSIPIIENLKWLGHDGFAVTTGDLTLMIDPFKVESDSKADIILVTHAHYDHCSPEDIARLAKPTTVIVTEPESAEKVREICKDVRVLAPGENLSVSGIAIETHPAYNTNKDFHPKAKNWLGFIVTMDGTRIYHAGDTDLIPEMDDLSVDIALLPVSGTYVMTADEAVEAARKIKPKIAIPMHYDSIVGTTEDARAFKDALGGEMQVVILEKG